MSALTEKQTLASATEFSRSQAGRDADFSTNSTERGTFYLDERHSNPAAAQEYDDAPEPRGIHSRRKHQRKVKGRLIIQFAANDPVHLADAAELARPFVDAIDLNCGKSRQGHSFHECQSVPSDLASFCMRDRLPSEVGVPRRHRVRFASKARACQGSRADDQTTTGLGIPGMRENSSRSGSFVSLRFATIDSSRC